MKCNVGEGERIVRLATGMGLLGAAWLAPVNRWTRIGMLAAGAELLYTGAVRYCPLNEVAGRTSCDAPLLSETRAGRLEREEWLGPDDGPPPGAA